MVLDFTLPIVTVELVIKRLRYQKNWYKIDSDNSGMVLKTCGLGVHLATCWQVTLATCANVMCTTFLTCFSCQVIFATDVMSNALVIKSHIVQKKFGD